jgi:hypothetical protein
MEHKFCLETYKLFLLKYYSNINYLLDAMKRIFIRLNDLDC